MFRIKKKQKIKNKDVFLKIKVPHVNGCQGCYFEGYSLIGCIKAHKKIGIKCYDIYNFNTDYIIKKGV